MFTIELAGQVFDLDNLVEDEALELTEEEKANNAVACRITCPHCNIVTGSAVLEKTSHGWYKIARSELLENCVSIRRPCTECAKAGWR